MSHNSRSRTRKIGRQGKFDVFQIDDSFTRRSIARQESIDIAKANALRSVANQRGAQRAQLARAKTQASAASAASSLRAGVAASNSSRLLAEFEAGRSQKRALDVRRSDQAIGLSTAGFASSGIQSSGAASEIARQSALSRNISESSLNARKESLIQQGSAGIVSALSNAISSAGSIKAAGQTFTAKAAATSSFNPFETTKAYAAPGRLPFISRGF